MSGARERVVVERQGLTLSGEPKLTFHLLGEHGDTLCGLDSRRMERVLTSWREVYKLACDRCRDAAGVA